MDLIEAKKLKSELEDQIRLLLVNFQIKTGLTVENVRMYTKDVATLHGEESVIQRVEIECKLG